VNSLPKTVTRQHCDCDLNPGPSVPESSTLTTRLPSHSYRAVIEIHEIQKVSSINADCSFLVLFQYFLRYNSLRWLPTSFT